MDICKELRKLANPEKVERYRTFHKTDKKGYANGEEFLGITVPQMRELSLDYLDLSFNTLSNLLDSRVHEEKYIVAVILSEKFKISNDIEKERIFDFAIKNASRLSGWDLVDTVAPGVIGKFLLDRDKSILTKFANSSNLWEKRVSIVATYEFIKKGDFNDCLKISKLLLGDKHDLIHKAVGWMLREVGKKDETVLKKFLRDNYSKLPRTTLRYAIEKFPEKERKEWLKRQGI